MNGIVAALCLFAPEPAIDLPLLSFRSPAIVAPVALPNLTRWTDHSLALPEPFAFSSPKPAPTVSPSTALQWPRTDGLHPSLSPKPYLLRIALNLEEIPPALPLLPGYYLSTANPPGLTPEPGTRCGPNNEFIIGHTTYDDVRAQWRDAVSLTYLEPSVRVLQIGDNKYLSIEGIPLDLFQTFEQYHFDRQTLRLLDYIPSRSTLIW